jgi:hypothetical protein
MALRAKTAIYDNVSSILVAILGFFLFLVCFYVLIYRGAPLEAKVDPPRESFHDCVVEIQALSKLQINSLGDYVSLYNLCNDQIFRTFQYNDFAVRREKFVRQELDERVNLWLVVIITISGVVLAAIQLVMSYKIAVSGKEHWDTDAAFAVKQGEISFKSSVTGLAILALSLAFFVVYVGWIYPNKEVGASLGAPVPFTNDQQLPSGGLGTGSSPASAPPK